MLNMFFFLTATNIRRLKSGNEPKGARSNTSHLEAHADFFRLLMKGIFDPYVL